MTVYEENVFMQKQKIFNVKGISGNYIAGCISRSFRELAIIL
jgi:hypothetical protein